MAWSFEDWYRRNKEAFNEKRRARYNQDKAYRKRVLETNKKSREKYKSRDQEEKRAQKEAVKIRIKERWKRYQQYGTAFFSVGALAEAVGVSVLSIRNWESKGLIPETPYRSRSGNRLYSYPQIMQIVEDLKEQGRIKNKAGTRAKTRTIECMVKYVGGEKKRVRLYQVGLLAEVLDRSRRSVRHLEQQGRLPATPFRATGGNRLYTYEMIKAASQAYEKGPFQGEEWRSFYREVKRSWKELGIFGARVVGGKRV